MNVSKHPSTDDTSHGGGVTPPSIGSAPGVLPEVQKPRLAANSQTGVSTRNVHSGNDSPAAGEDVKELSHWYVLRVTYGREMMASEYLRSQHVEVYCPTVIRHKLVDGHRREVEESRLPNLFFAHDTFNHLKTFVYDNVTDETKSLRFYYHFCRKKDNTLIREPLIVPDYQMDGLKIICTSEAEDILLVPSEVNKFRQGQKVRVIGGPFKGVVGRVDRYRGQQRVAIIIEGLLTIATAYVPSAFLEDISQFHHDT